VVERGPRHNIGARSYSPSFLLYGLHPVDFETRVMQALEKVRPYLQSHGGSVDLLSVDEGVVRLRLRANGRTYASSSAT
jgi:hypothetical protein